MIRVNGKAKSVWIETKVRLMRLMIAAACFAAGARTALAYVPEPQPVKSDVEKNVNGSRAAGWNAIRFVTNDQVEADFESLV